MTLPFVCGILLSLISFRYFTRIAAEGRYSQKVEAIHKTQAKCAHSTTRGPQVGLFYKEARQDQQAMDQDSSTTKSKKDEDEELILITTMPFRNARVQIYKQQGEPNRYFYEPILLLDPTKVQCQMNKAINKTYIRFPVEMWNQEVERQVAAFLKKLPGCSDVEDFLVQVMPYDELRLATSGDLNPSGSYHPSTNGTPYRQLHQKLNFHLFCETKEAADSLLESFRQDPDLYLEGLTLNCISIKDESQRKRPLLSDGRSTSSTDSFPSSKYLRFHVETCSTASAFSTNSSQPGQHSKPQVPATSRSNNNGTVKTSNGPVVDLSILLNGLKGPFAAMVVIFFLSLNFTTKYFVPTISLYLTVGPLDPHRIIRRFSRP